MKKKKRPRGRPNLPWEYWNDLWLFGLRAGHWREAGGTYGLKPNKEREKIVQHLQSLYPMDSADPMDNLEQAQNFFRALRQLPRTKELREAFRHPRRHLLGLQRVCQEIMEDGPLRWVSNGTVVSEIKDWETLRARISGAHRHVPVCCRWELPPITTELWQGGKLLRGKCPDNSEIVFDQD